MIINISLHGQWHDSMLISSRAPAGHRQGTGRAPGRAPIRAPAIVFFKNWEKLQGTGTSVAGFWQGTGRAPAGHRQGTGRAPAGPQKGSSKASGHQFLIVLYNLITLLRLSQSAQDPMAAALAHCGSGGPTPPRPHSAGVGPLRFGRPPLNQFLTEQLYVYIYVYVSGSTKYGGGRSWEGGSPLPPPWGINIIPPSPPRQNI